MGYSRICHQCPLSAPHRPASSQGASVLFTVSGPCREGARVSSHVLLMTAQGVGRGAVSILKMRVLKLRGQEGWCLPLPEPDPGRQGGRAPAQGPTDSREHGEGFVPAS